jgi:hypothetical protein
MSWLGHQESEMIRHYYHMQPDEARRQMSKLPPLAPLADAEAADGTGGYGT